MIYMAAQRGKRGLMSIRLRISKVGRMPKQPKGIDLAIIKVVDKEASDTRKDFQRTTRTWKSKPDFYIRVRGKQSREVYTTNIIYSYVEGGTKPHVIRVRFAKTLRFNTSGFKPKSRPNSIASYGGAAAQPPTAFPKQVQHPGMKARNYVKLIQAKSQKRFKQNMDKVFARFGK